MFKHNAVIVGDCSRGLLSPNHLRRRKRPRRRSHHHFRRSRAVVEITPKTLDVYVGEK